MTFAAAKRIVLAGPPRPGDVHTTLPDSRAERSPLSGDPAERRQTPAATSRVLVLIPAYNEARNLPAVVRELRADAPGTDILIIDDGSDDDTGAILPTLGVRWLRLSQRMGIGGAVRTGLRYATSRGFDIVVRLDGDGQHPASLVSTLAAPILRAETDVVIGSRYKIAPRPESVSFVRRVVHYALGRVLSTVSGRVVTDPTSGLWAFGPAALSWLAVHHPSGYPEPELVLLLSRTRLRIAEIPVVMRDRLTGSSSLTLRRTLTALARLVLHLIVVPLRDMRREQP